MEPSGSDSCLWVVHCLDDQEDGLIESTPRSGFKKRIENYPAHKAYQGSTTNPTSDIYIKKIAAGPLLSDDGSHMVGSCFILSSTKPKVDAFVENDPFYRAGVWRKDGISIHRYISIPNGILAHA